MPEKDGAVDVPVRLNQASTDPGDGRLRDGRRHREAGKDYTAASGTLTFAPGETQKTVTLKSLDDGVDEPSETFYLNLSNPARASRSATGHVDGHDRRRRRDATFDGATKTIVDFEGT